LIGAAFIEFVPNLADKVSKAAPGAVYGVILIAVMFLMPAGAGGFLSQMWRKIFRARSAAPEALSELGAVAIEPGSDLTGIETGSAFTKAPVVTENTRRNA